MANLTQRVTNWTKSNSESAVDGLVLMRDLVAHMAAKHDWDAASQLMTALDKQDASAINAFKLVIRSCFGTIVSYKKDAKHPTGGRFSFGLGGKWPDGPYVPNSKAWLVVQDAIKAGLGFRSAAFLKDVRAALGDTVDDFETEEEKAEREAKEAIAKIERRAMNDAKTLFADGISLEVFLGKVTHEYKKLARQRALELQHVVMPKADVVEIDEKAA